MRLSVCVITYNHEQFIEQCVKSILDQDVDFDYDIIVGEDCSTDSTPSILARLESENRNRLKVIYNRPNIGSRANFNRTLAACDGEYIAFLEGDDYWTSRHKLQLQVDFLNNNAHVSCVFHRTRVVNADDPASEIVIPPSDPAQFSSFDFQLQFGGCSMCLGSIMARRACLADIETWLADVKPGDWAMDMMLATKGAIGFIPLEMSHYRAHAAGHWTGLSPFIRVAKTLHMLQHVSGLVTGANRDLVDQRIAAIVNWLGSELVVDGAMPFKQVLKELRNIGDVRLSDNLLGQIVTVARSVNEAKQRYETQAKTCESTAEKAASAVEELVSLTSRLLSLDNELVTLRSKLNGAEEVVERLRNDIESGNRAIYDIKRSLSWKIVSPLWRLETRGQRKARARRPTKLHK